MLVVRNDHGYGASRSCPGPEFRGGSMLKPYRMTITKRFTAGFAGAVVLAFGLGMASADAIEWNDAMSSAARAVKESRFADAERWLRTAIKEAQRFGPEDRRLAESLSSLA